MKIFSRTALKELALDIEGNPEAYRDRYQQETPWAVDPALYKESPGLEVPHDLCGKLLDAANSGGPRDAQLKAAVALHRELFLLAPRQAANPLLWTRLAHQECWPYMRRVAPVAPASESNDTETLEKETERLRRRILSSYVVESSTRLTRHALGKLWWFAHISFDPQKDEYNETRIKTLINLKEIMERSYGRCPELVKIVVDFISENQSVVAGDIEFLKRRFPGQEKLQPMKTHWRFLLRDLNRFGANSVLSALEYDEVRNFLEQSLWIIRNALRERGYVE